MTVKPLLAGGLLLGLAAAETSVTPAIEGADLFKNGLVVLRASFPAAAAGEYVWEDAPTAVHGSFWVEGDTVLETRGGSRSVLETVRAEGATGDPQKDLAGQEVRVFLEDTTPKTGVVWELPEEEAAPPEIVDPFMRGAPRREEPPEATSGTFLVLRTEEGERVMIARSRIRWIEAPDRFAPQQRRVERPVLRFKVGEGGGEDARVRVSWLARGMSWAPSYRVELGEGGKMVIEQSAVIRNELIDLEGTELGLISGFPNVRFGEVESPLWPGTTLAGFFSQLGQPFGRPSLAIAQNIASNAMSYAGGAGALPDLGEPGVGSDDLHIEAVGARDLAKGESLALSVDAADADFERVVEWTVPDARDARGRYAHREMGDGSDEPWDAVRFRNPFDFPMTTAPAMIRDGGRFRGQTRSDWVNPGEVNCLRVTKALSVRAEYSEVEEEGEREIVWIGGNDYQRTKVKGTMKLRNARGEAVTMSIRAEFSGELLEADRDPGKRLRTEGVGSVNPRRELVWDFELGAGEEAEFGFRYSVLVDR